LPILSDIRRLLLKLCVTDPEGQEPLRILTLTVLKSPADWDEDVTLDSFEATSPTFASSSSLDFEINLNPTNVQRDYDVEIDITSMVNDIVIEAGSGSNGGLFSLYLEIKSGSGDKSLLWIASRTHPFKVGPELFVS
jgi:hypothetical protein